MKVKWDSCAPKYITEMIFGQNVQTQKPDITKTTTLACFNEILKLIIDIIGQKRGGFTYKLSLGSQQHEQSHSQNTEEKMPSSRRNNNGIRRIKKP